MKRNSFIVILIACMLFSGKMFGQITAKRCIMDSIKLYSSAIGYETTAWGKYSLTAGYHTYTDKANSFVFGTGTTSPNNVARYLEAPSSNSFLIGFENKPVFFARLDSTLYHRVGIGTVTPLTALDVNGTTRTDTLRVINKSVQYTGDQLGFYPVTEGGNSGSKNPIPRLFLNDNKVGIMTNNPTATLDVNGNVRVDTVKIKRSIFMTEDALSFTYSTSGAQGLGNSDSDDGDSILLLNKGLPPGGEEPHQSTMHTLMTLKYVNGARLGIGTTTPLTRLHVVGDQFLSGPLTIGGSAPALSEYMIKLQIGNTWTFSDLNNGKIMGYNCRFSSQNSQSERIETGAAAAVVLGANGAIQLRTAPVGSGNLTWNYVTMLNNGNIGIGTENPTKKLHVQGDSYFSGKVGVGITSSDFPLDVNGSANFTNVYTNNIYFPGTEMRISKSGTGLSPRDTTRYITDIMTFTKDGDVGIGTTNPEQRLHVEGYGCVSGNFGIGTTNPTKRLHVQGDSYFNGNVGIGTSTPQSKLQIQDGVFSLAIGKATGQSLNYGTTYIGFNAVRNNATQEWTLAGDGANNGGSVIWTTVGGDIYFSSIPSTNGNSKTLTDAQVKSNIKIHLTTGGILKTKDVLVTSTNWPDFVFEKDYPLMSLQETEQFIKENKHLPEIPSAVEITENGVNLGEMNALLLKKVEELTLYILQQNSDIQTLKEEVRLLKEER